MTKVFVSAVIDAPIGEVWAKMRDFNGLPDWHPRFSRSHIEGGCAATPSAASATSTSSAVPAPSASAC
jgi:hypothetical protein